MTYTTDELSLASKMNSAGSSIPYIEQQILADNPSDLESALANSGNPYKRSYTKEQLDEARYLVEVCGYYMVNAGLRVGMTTQALRRALTKLGVVRGGTAGDER